MYAELKHLSWVIKITFRHFSFFPFGETHVNRITALRRVFSLCLPRCSVKTVAQQSHWNKGHQCWTLILIFLAEVLGNRLILLSACRTVYVFLYTIAHVLFFSLVVGSIKD